MIFISMIYIFDYAINEKYSIEYASIYNYSRNASEIVLMDLDNEINPYLEINISIDAYFDPYVAVYKKIEGKNNFSRRKIC